MARGISHRRSGLQRTMVVVLVATLSVVGLGVAPAAADPHQSVSGDVPGNYPGWMGWLPDEVGLTELSLPGTHDSGTYTVGGTGSACKTQALSISEQLQAGIRVLDIRASRQIDADEVPYFEVDHGSCNLGLNFRDIAADVAKFLGENPNETVLVKLGHSGLTDDHDDDAMSWGATFEEVVERSGLTDAFWDPATDPKATTYTVGLGNAYTGFPDNEAEVLAVPTLGQVRGKIVLWRGPGWEGDKTNPDVPLPTDQPGQEFGKKWGISNWAVSSLMPGNYWEIETCAVIGGYCWKDLVRAAEDALGTASTAAASTTAARQACAAAGPTTLPKPTECTSFEKAKLSFVGIDASTSFGLCYVPPYALLVCGLELFPYSASDDINLEIYRHLAGKSDEIGTSSGISTGVISMDFPGGGLIGAIIAHNLRLIDPPDAVLENGLWTQGWGDLTNREFGKLVTDLFEATEGGGLDRAITMRATLERLLPDLAVYASVQNYESGETERANPVTAWPSLGHVAKLDDWMVTAAVAPPNGGGTPWDESTLSTELVRAANFIEGTPSLYGRAKQVRNRLNSLNPNYVFAVTVTTLDGGAQNRGFATTDFSQLPFAFSAEIDGYSYAAVGVRVPAFADSPVVNAQIEIEGPDSVAPDDVAVYDVTVTSTGGTAINNAEVAVTVPSATSFDADGSSPGWSCADGAAPGTRCVMSVGALIGARDIPMNGTVSQKSFKFALEVGTPRAQIRYLRPAASVATLGQSDVYAGDNVAAALSNWRGSVDLNLAIAVTERRLGDQPLDASAPFEPGELIELELIYDNTGERATEATIRVELSEGLTPDPVSGFSDCGFTTVYVCQVDVTAVLEPGDNPAVIGRVKVDSTVPDDLLYLGVAARIDPSTPLFGDPFVDTNPFDNDAGVAFARDHDLAISIEALNRDPILTPGVSTPFDVVVTNLGAPVQDAIVELRLPGGISLDPASGWSCVPEGEVEQRCTTAVTDLGLFGTGEVLALVTVDAPAAADMTVASISATVVDAAQGTIDRQPSNNNAVVFFDVEAEADLHVTLTSDPTEVAPGSEVELAIAYGNRGDRAAGPSSLKLELPQGVVPNGDPDPGWSCAPDGDVVGCEWEFPEGLADDSAVPLMLPVEVTADIVAPVGGELPVTAQLLQLDPAAPDSDFEDNEDRVLLRVVNRGPDDVSIDMQGGVEGETLWAVARFDDDEGQSHTCVFDWDDGSSLEVDADGLECRAPHEFTDDGRFFVSVEVVDEFDARAEVVVVEPVVVGNADPEIQRLTVTPATGVGEGTLVTVEVEFTDPGVADSHVCGFDWGDSTTETTSGDGSCRAQHVYADDGDVIVAVTVTDDDGGVARDARAISVANVAPQVTPLGDIVVDEGTLVSGLTTSFTDAGTADRHTATIDWGDGFDTAVVDELPFGPPGSTEGLTGLVRLPDHTYVDDLSGRTRLCVHDDDDLRCVESGVTVSNVAPTIVSTSLSTADSEEGDTVDARVEFTDPGLLDEFVVSFDWGDGTSSGATSISESEPGRWVAVATHTYADDDPTGTPSDVYTVSATVGDDDGGITEPTDVGSLTVTNVAPSVSFTVDRAAVAENATVTLSGSILDPSSGGPDGDSFLISIDWGDGTTPTLAGVGAGAPRSFGESHQYLDDGDYDVTVVVTDDDTGVSVPVVRTVAVENEAPVAFAPSGPAPTVQYSDAFGGVTFVATDVAGYPGDPETLTATATAWANGSPVAMNLVAGPAACSPGDARTGRASPRQTCVWTVVPDGNVSLAPGTYSIRFTVTDDDGGTATAEGSITVVPEDARVDYSGPSFAATTSARDGTAVIELRATIRDITAVPDDSATDPWPGDITNAVVDFVDRDNGDAVLCTAPVQRLFESDMTIGTAACEWTATIGSADSAVSTIGTIVRGYYVRDARIDDAVVTIAKPLDRFITGGGFIDYGDPANSDVASAGVLAADPESKSNFGFAVKFNKKGTKLQGRATIIIRSGGRIYQVKTNRLDSMGIWGEDPTQAEFEARANLTDVTDPDAPVSLGGALRLQMVMTDFGSHTDDTIGWTLYDKDGVLLFSSNWSGAQTDETAAQGNIVLHD